jgi:uncharacterized membrane protein
VRLTNVGPAAPAAASVDETATGLSPRTAAALAYLAWWLTGALFLAIEPSHAYVRFHARQSLVVFGGLWLLGTALSLFSFAVVFVSPAAFRVVAVLPLVTWSVAIPLWVVCLVQAARGKWWAVPGLKRTLGGRE